MTDQPERKLTPTENLKELALAAITKPAGTARGAESVEIAQVHVGPLAGRWYCKNLGAVAQEGETIMQLWSRTLDAARQVQRDVAKLNADDKDKADLDATLEEKAKGAKS